MNLRQLEAFRATMEAGSITGAAELLHISQPSVSRLVADLERSVGFPLFRRVGRGLTATVEAHRFHQAMESMFLGIERLRETADTIRTTPGGTVALGVIPALSQSVMPEAVRDLYRQRPDVRFMIYTRNTPGIVDAVRMQQVDLGLVGRAPPYPGVEVLFETTVPYVCLLPAGHPLTKGSEALDLDHLAGRESFVTFGGAYPDEMMNMEHKLSDKLRANSRLSAANMPIAAALVRETGALAIVDPFTAKITEQLGGVVSRPIQQPLTYRIALVTRGLDTLSLVAEELADMLIAKLRGSVL